MVEMVYCDMRGVDVNESFCYGCSEPAKHGVDLHDCPFMGTAQEDQI